MPKALKIIWSILGKIVVAFLIFILICNLYIAYKKSTTDEALPKVFGFASAIVTSGSMEPTLSIDDYLIIREQSPDEYEVGDIITFMQPQGRTPVTHRIFSRDGDSIVTVGDANKKNGTEPAPDDTPIDVSAVIGEVTTVIPGVGKLMEFFKQPIGLILFVVLAFAIIELPNFGDKLRDNKKKKKLAAESEAQTDSLSAEPPSEQPQSSEPPPSGSDTIQ